MCTCKVIREVETKIKLKHDVYCTCTCTIDTANLSFQIFSYFVVKFVEVFLSQIMFVDQVIRSQRFRSFALQQNFYALQKISLQ